MWLGSLCRPIHTGVSTLSAYRDNMQDTYAHNHRNLLFRYRRKNEMYMLARRLKVLSGYIKCFYLPTGAITTSETVKGIRAALPDKLQAELTTDDMSAAIAAHAGTMISMDDNTSAFIYLCFLFRTERALRLRSSRENLI